jgi:hypothetical protein
MQFWGDQTVKKTDDFIGKASGTRGLNFVESGFPVFSLKKAGGEIESLASRWDHFGGKNRGGA